MGTMASKIGGEGATVGAGATRWCGTSGVNKRRLGDAAAAAAGKGARVETSFAPTSGRDRGTGKKRERNHRYGGFGPEFAGPRKKFRGWLIIPDLFQAEKTSLSAILAVILADEFFYRIC